MATTDPGTSRGRASPGPGSSGRARVGGGVPAWMALSALGFEMASTVLLLGGAGWLLDWWLGWKPWGLLVGLLLGCVLGMLNLVRGAIRAMDADTPPAKKERP